MDWSIVIFVFGRIPELWGLGPPDSCDSSRAEPSGALLGRTAKTPEVSNAGPLTKRDEASATANAQSVAPHHKVLSPSFDPSRPSDSNSVRGIYRDNFGSFHSLPNLHTRSTDLELATSPGEGDRSNP